MSRQIGRNRLPNPPRSIQDPEVYRYLLDLIKTVENIMIELQQPINDGWQPANVPSTGNRNIDANTATLDETRKSLARLIQDMKERGYLGS